MPHDPNVPDLFDVRTLVILRSGDNPPPLSEADADELQRQHLAYRAELGRRGVLVANGPTRERSNPTIRGLSIFACSLDEARRLTEDDPGVRAGVFGYDIMEWWTRAGAVTFPLAGRPVGDQRPID
jgi:uncharacterized protein YciI